MSRELHEVILNILQQQVFYLNNKYLYVEQSKLRTCCDISVFNNSMCHLTKKIVNDNDVKYDT